MFRKLNKISRNLRRGTALLAAWVLLMGLVSQTGTTWAWFTDNSTGSLAAIQMATFDMDVTFMGDTSFEETQGVYPLEAGTYQVSLSVKEGSTATQGYCHIVASGKVLKCVPVKTSEAEVYEVSFQVEEPSDVAFEVSWGQCSIAHEETPMVFMSSSEAPSLSVGEVMEEEIPAEDEILTEEETPTEEEILTEEETPAEEEIPAEEETPVEEEAPAEEEIPADEEPTVEEETPTEEPELPQVSDTSMILVSSSETVSNTVMEAEEEKVREMPLYFQNDYPDQRYGSGTVATSGCGITSLAMVSTYLTGHDYFPDELAQWFGGDAENNVKRLEFASEAMQLPWEYAENFDVTMQGLKDGKIAIALMREGSLFTEGQHFIVLKGLTEDGKILVNDPNSGNYAHWRLQDGFENGFIPGDIVVGYDSAWLYDPAQMPEEPYIYEEAFVERIPRYPGVELTAEEQELIAKVIWVEAQGECFAGQQAVAEIVLNRLVSGKFGETVSNVIYGEGQFRSVPKLPDATPWQVQYEALDAALYGEGVLPKDVYYFATEKTNENVWGQIGGHIFCYEAG